MEEEKVYPLDLRDPAAIQLERIANALEEQNRFNWQWLEQNRTWNQEGVERMEQEKEESAIRRAENMALEHERSAREARLMTIAEENARRDQSHREHLQRLTEEQVHETNETIQASYAAYIESLKSPSRELVQAVGETLVNDIRKSTGVREHE